MNSQPEQKDVYAEALTDNGVPSELAQKAGEIIASDDPTKPDLGRSESDQETINEAMNHYWQSQKGIDE